MNGIINNGGLNAGRKGMKMKSKLKIVFLFCMIMVVSLGCIEPQKLPNSNETKIATPEPTPSPTEQKLPTYNETKPLEFNGTFETWSRGYRANESYEHLYFRVITNYSEWISFLDGQGYFTEIRREGSQRLEGTLFPGKGVKPKTIENADFNEHFIIAALMGRRGYTEPNIEIINISRINNIVNVTVYMYIPKAGDLITSWPYHIIIVKREVLPRGNSTFIFTDTEGKELGKLEVKK